MLAWFSCTSALAAPAPALQPSDALELGSRSLGTLGRTVEVGSTQLVLRAEDPLAFASSLQTGTWVSIAHPHEEIPIRHVGTSPGAVQLELLWPTAHQHPEYTDVTLLMVPSSCDDPPSPLLLPRLPEPDGYWPRYISALDMAAASLTDPLVLVYQPRTGAFGVSALPPAASRCDGPSAPLAAGWLAPFRRFVPLPGQQLLSFSPRDGFFEVLGCGWDTLLGRATARERVDALQYNRSRPATQLPCVRRTHGAWAELRGHELSMVGGRLLAYEPYTSKFSLWAFDTDVSGRADPIRLSEGPLASGSWHKKFGEGDGGDALASQPLPLTLLTPHGLLLQRSPAERTYGLWSAARLASADVGLDAHPMGGSACEPGPCVPRAEMEDPKLPAGQQAPPLMAEPSARPPSKGGLLAPVTAGPVAWECLASHQLEPLPWSMRWPSDTLDGGASALQEAAASRQQLILQQLIDVGGAAAGSGVAGGGSSIFLQQQQGPSPTPDATPAPTPQSTTEPSPSPMASQEGGAGDDGEDGGSIAAGPLAEVRLIEWDGAGSGLFRLLHCTATASGLTCDVQHGGHALRHSWPCDGRSSAVGCAQEGEYCAWCEATQRCVPAAYPPSPDGVQTPCLDGYVEGVC